MRTKRQNIQLELALEPAAKGEARSAGAQRTEARTARAEPERPATAHSGTGTFRFKLTFSENIAVSYRTLRDSAFDVSGGEITRAQRAQRGSNLAWWITVRPNRYDDVDVTLRGGRACNVTGSICTSGGHQLQGTVSATIPIGQ